MIQKHKKQRQMAEINVVPYIDVMLVLLVIFMITAPLLSQGVNVDLPEASAKAIAMNQPEPIIVSVDNMGNYYLNIVTNTSKPISLDELLQQTSIALQNAKIKGQKLDVLVKGDRAADYGKVVQAMTVLQQAGAQSIGLMTQEPPNKR